MVNGNGMQGSDGLAGPREERYLQQCLRGLFCCFFRLPGDEQRMRTGGDFGPGEQTVQITVENLGMRNVGFSLLDEEPPRRSANPVRVCTPVLRKRRVKPPRSISQDVLLISSSGEDGDEEEEKEKEHGLLLKESAVADGLWAQPAFHLIPPTPSSVADEGQFFNVSPIKVGVSEGGSAHERKSCGEAEEAPAALTLAEDGERERDPQLSAMSKDEGKKLKFSRRSQQGASLAEYPRKSSLRDRQARCSDLLKAECCLRPNGTNMDSYIHHRRPITRSLSAGETLTRSATFHALSSAYDHREVRRTSIASYVPESEDQNGNFPLKDIDRQEARFLGKLNTDEVCQWFTGIGLTKCLPFIREAKLCGADIAAVDMDILDTLHITTLEDREHLLSAIYNELHPPNAITERLDSLLESVGPADIKTFTETLASMSKSRSSPQVSCLSATRRSLKLRGNRQNYTSQRNSQFIEITINASERIVHLRTPRETTVAKVIESCIKTLGTMDDKSFFALKESAGSSEDLQPERQIGTLLKSTSEQTQLELHLCKMDKLSSPAAQTNSESNSSDETGGKSIQVSQTAKGERIKELKEQVDSLQNVILQIQELHHDLVAFCSELKSMDGDTNVDRLGCDELEQKLELVKSTLNSKKESLQSLRDNASNPTCQRRKHVDVRLLEKMRLNCQVFKEEISIVHLNRQVAHLQSALQESYDEIEEKAQKRKSLAIGSLSQLVSPQSPAMLLVVQENRSADGRYGFTCRCREGSGLVVDAVDAVDSYHLCVGDRLVEVNGVPVVNATGEELTELLLQGPSAQIVVLRHPPAGPTSLQHPPLPPVPGTVQNISLARAAVAMETPAQRKVIAL